LQQLLYVEYPNSNLPMVILNSSPASQDIDQYYTFISVVYWQKLAEMAPGWFQNPLEPDAQAYAEVRMMIPRPRLVWIQPSSSGGAAQTPLGGVPGETAYMPSDGSSSGGPSGSTGTGSWVVGRQNVPTSWNLMNQSWGCQLAPVTQPALVTILQTAPPYEAFQAANLKLPNLGNLTTDDIQKISPH
jgi:hypothetical protein